MSENPGERPTTQETQEAMQEYNRRMQEGASSTEIFEAMQNDPRVTGSSGGETRGNYGQQSTTTTGENEKPRGLQARIAAAQAKKNQ